MERKTPTCLTSETPRTMATARVDLETAQVCPYCQQAMRVLKVDGHEAHVCIKDRICFPVKD